LFLKPSALAFRLIGSRINRSTSQSISMPLIIIPTSATNLHPVAKQQTGWLFRESIIDDTE